MNDPAENSAEVRRFVGDELRLPAVGFCRTEDLAETIDERILPAVRELEFAIVLGHPLSNAVLDTIDDRPNLLYKHHYQQVNWRLDRAATELALFLELRSAKAMPIPASVIVDWENQRGHLCHRTAAITAGIGWRGRHGLVVTPQFGAQMRFATVLTNIPLPPCEPMENLCGDCTACISACPAGAISQQGCDVGKCFELLKEFSKMRGIGQFICGVCIKACEGGR
ncbi:MAG TPA: epoxyqueuosine reductase [candidate division Zixibacteria bacterium]|nr:epoxyqueuosine reductase [candidate division Zixibacteria bacterium]